METLGLYSGQVASGLVVFRGLEPDVSEIQVTVKNIVVRFNYLGEPIQTVDLAYGFER